LHRERRYGEAMSLAAVALQIAQSSPLSIYPDVYVADAHLQRALAAIGLQQAVVAENEINEGRSAARAIKDEAQRNRSLADFDFANALLLQRSNSAAAVDSLDHAITFFRTNKIDHFLPRLYHVRAMTIVDRNQAISDSETALDLLGTQRQKVSDLAHRASMYEVSADEIAATLMTNLFREGRIDDAFAVAERVRANVLTERISAKARNDGDPLVMLRRRLDSDTALASFVFLDGGVGVQVATRSTLLSRRLDVAPKRIEALTAQLSADDPDSTRASEELYDLLLRPIGAALSQSQALIVIADDTLAAIPFAQLRDRGTGRYLIESRRLSYAPAIRALLASGKAEQQIAASDAQLVVADPAFDRRIEPALDRLPAAAREGEAIASRVPGSLLLSGSAATIDRTIAELSRYPLIHIAAHAVTSHSSSYLVLADGRLSAERIGQTDLRHCKLALLASCSSARPSQLSDGIRNLARAFLAAGARNVIATKRDVPDSTTFAFMKACHELVLAGEEPARALQQTQIRAIRGELGTMPPKDWASFEVIGSGSTLPVKDGTTSKSQLAMLSH
jgi:CHAT domain-containing protein